MVCDAPYFQNEFGDPPFFYVFNIILSFSTYSQSLKKICKWELLGANVLKLPISPKMTKTEKSDEMGQGETENLEHPDSEL